MCLNQAHWINRAVWWNWWLGNFPQNQFEKEWTAMAFGPFGNWCQCWEGFSTLPETICCYAWFCSRHLCQWENVCRCHLFGVTEKQIWAKTPSGCLSAKSFIPAAISPPISFDSTDVGPSSYFASAISIVWSKWPKKNPLAAPLVRETPTDHSLPASNVFLESSKFILRMGPS